MAKRVIWSSRARDEQRKIYEYWNEHNGDKKYSNHLNKLFVQKIKLIKKFNNIGYETDLKFIRATRCSDYIIFYKLNDAIEIAAIWDSRQELDKLNIK